MDRCKKLWSKYCPPRLLFSKHDMLINIVFLYCVALLILLLGNDIHVNPGPNVSRFSHNNISIVNLNVNSVRHKTDLISAELGEHDIICLTESKHDDSINSNNICIDNYHNRD